MADPASDPSLAHRVAAVRRFNRFYTRTIGVLQEGLLHSTFSLTEARVLYELAHREGLTAADLCRDLGLDAGYLSRILKTFDQRGLITRSVSPRDARQTLLALTPAGHAAFEPLDRASQADILAMTGGLAPEQSTALVRAMRTVENLMGGGNASSTSIVLRPHRLGDIDAEQGQALADGHPQASFLSTDVAVTEQITRLIDTAV